MLSYEWLLKSVSILAKFIRCASRCGFCRCTNKYFCTLKLEKYKTNGKDVAFKCIWFGQAKVVQNIFNHFLSVCALAGEVKNSDLFIFCPEIDWQSIITHLEMNKIHGVLKTLKAGVVGTISLKSTKNNTKFLSFTWSWFKVQGWLRNWKGFWRDDWVEVQDYGLYKPFKCQEGLPAACNSSRGRETKTGHILCLCAHTHKHECTHTKHTYKHTWTKDRENSIKYVSFIKIFTTNQNISLKMVSDNSS